LKEFVKKEALRIKKDVLKKILPAIVGFSVIIFLIFQSNAFELFTIILTVDLRFFLISILFYIVINLVQSLRIKVVLHSQGYENISALKIFWIHMAGNLMGDATPGRTGYLSIAYFLKEDVNIRLSHGLHSIPYVHSLDFAIKAITTSLAIVYLIFTLSIGIEIVRALLIVVGFGIVIAFLLFLVLFGVCPQPIQSLLSRWTLGKQLLNTLQIFREGTVKTRSVFSFIIGLSLCSWFLWGLCFYALGFSVGIHLPFLTFMFVYPFASLVSVVPLSIGGIGLVEAGLTGMIILYGVSFEKSLAFALLTRLVKIIVNVITGAKTLFLRKNRKNHKLNTLNQSDAV